MRTLAVPALALASLLLASLVAAVAIPPSRGPLGDTVLAGWRHAARLELARCLSDPEHFSIEVPERASFRAYDLEGRSRSREAPSLPTELRGALEPGASNVSATGTPWGADGLRVAMRLGDEGPCAVVAGRIFAPPEERPRVIGRTVARQALVAVLLASVIAALVLVPTARRVRRLADQATRVGTAAYAPVNDSRRDEIGALARALDGAHASLLRTHAERERRMQDLELFLAQVAHDLRTPLTTLALTLERLEANDGDLHARRAAIREIESDVVYLASLVENLRLAARLEHGWRPDEEVSELRAVAERVWRRARVLGERSGIVVDAALPEPGIEVRCAEVALERLLTNLVQNALTHAPAARSVLIAVRADGGRFSIEVADDGAAPPPTALPRPTLPRVETDRGLGLAVVAAIAERCGWSVSLSPSEAETATGWRVRLEGSTVAPR